MKLNYKIARSLIKTRWIRQKYLASISRRLFFVPKFGQIEDLEFCVDDYFGLKFCGHLGSMIEWETYFFGAFDHQGLDLIGEILKHLQKPFTCLDIGANVGTHSLYMSRLADRVYSFEPLPRNYRILEKNISINGIENIELFKCGLSDRNGKFRFFENPDKKYGSGSFDREHKDAGKVSSQSLQLRKGDDLLKDVSDIRFIKMDIEGLEYEALDGLQNTLAKNRPIIMMEYNDLTISKFASIENLYGKLPENYRISGTRMHKYKGLKRLFETQHLRLSPFIFEQNYEHLLLYPEEFSIEKALDH